MTNALGGGAGGFNHLLTHIGPAAVIWKTDMDAHSFEYSEENIAHLDVSVQKMMKKHPQDVVEQQRDQLLIDLIKAKAKEPNIV